MKVLQKTIAYIVCIASLLFLSRCENSTYPLISSNRCCNNTKIVVIYDNDSIPASMGISTGTYTLVDSFRYVNVFVEYQQESANEEPLSLGVVFALGKSGEKGSRRYFNFEQNFSGAADPQMITLSGKNSWHGTPKKSSYLARLPIMGPYMQVFPFNHHSKSRLFSVVLYLTQ